MDKFQDIEKLKKEVWALWQQVAQGSGSGDLSEKLANLEKEIAQVETDMKGADEHLRSELEICKNGQTVLSGDLSNCQNAQSQLRNDVDVCVSAQSAIVNEINNCKAGQVSLQNEINLCKGTDVSLQSQIDELAANASSGGISLGEVKSTTIIGGATDSGHIDFIVSDSQKIRFVFGTTDTKQTVVFDQPFSVLIGFTSTYAPTASTSMSCQAYKATIGECTTTSMKFMGNAVAASYVRYAVWGYVDL